MGTSTCLLPSKKYTLHPIIKLPGAHIELPGCEGNWFHESAIGSYSQNSLVPNG